jgi:phosphoribosylglycinamide formyltransferase-1
VSGGGSSAPRIAVLVSGGGRSLENLVEHTRDGRLDAKVAVVITNKADCGALERARRLEIPAVVLDPEKKLSPADFSRDVFVAAESFGCDLVVLAGFLRLLVIPDRWEARVLNIHPSLLPAFGGKGFYGDKVHAAVLASGAKETGCTVHYVTNEYDAGPILLQRRVPVLPGDDVHTLAARVFEAEKLALPEAIHRHFCLDPFDLAAWAQVAPIPKGMSRLVAANVLRVDGETVFGNWKGGVVRLDREDRAPWDRLDHFRLGERFLALPKAPPRSSDIESRVERASSAFVAELLSEFVPEVAQGIIEVIDVHRDPGQPATIQVRSRDPKLDPVAACIGSRADRIKWIVEELRGERVRLITDPSKLL